MGPGQQSPEPRAGRRDGLRQGGQCRSGAVDEQSAQVAVAASTDPQKLGLTSSRVLARYQAEPSRQIACPAERGSIVHSGNERSCRERADAGNGHQSSRRRIRPRPGDKLGIERPDGLIDASPLFPKIANQLLHPNAERRLGLRWPLKGDLRCLPYTTFDPLSRCRYAAYAGLKSAEKLKMATNLSEDPETGLEDLATEGQKERREFLRRCGRFAVVTPPATATSTLSSRIFPGRLTPLPSGASAGGSSIRLHTGP